MLEELQNPRATSEIGLLILRFAAELLNRAVLFVVKGGTGTRTVNLSPPAGTPMPADLLTTLYGDAYLERFGATVTPVGDLDADGKADLAVTSPHANAPGATSLAPGLASGAVRVFLGKDLKTDGTATLEGEPAEGDVFALATDVTLARGGRYLVALGTQLSARLDAKDLRRSSSAVGHSSHRESRPDPSWRELRKFSFVTPAS